MVEATARKAPRGRGARSNATGRYEANTTEAMDDGWTDDDAEVAKNCAAGAAAPVEIGMILICGTLESCRNVCP